MQIYLALLRRELETYFLSLTGYVVIAVSLLLLGFSFHDLLGRLNAEPTDAPVTELFYSTYYFWLILLLTSPVITMRLFALEKYSGTFETLMTAPIKEIQVVMAKYTGALVFYAATWLPLLGYALLVHQYASDADALSPGTLGSTYLGILLIGSVYMAAGCFASALTRSLMIAAMLSYGLGVALFLLSIRSLMGATLSGWSAKFFEYISMVEHMGQFARGLVDSRALVFYVTLTALFLFMTVKVLESRRWK